VKKILIVEDTVAVRDVVVSILKMEGYEVIEAENGKIGFDLALSENPDLIISDILMPVFDGYKLFSEIKNSPLTDGIPFIFLSSKADKNDIRIGMNLGADDYLTKPISIDDLLTVVSKKIGIQTKNQQEIEKIQNVISLSIPHELKTPLNCIQGLAEILMNIESDFDNNEVQEIAGDIFQSAERLNILIEKYILFTGLILKKINKTELYSKNIELDVEKIINNISIKVAKIYNRIDDLEISTVNFKFPFNEKYFSIIILEPVDNAFKFSKLGDKINVSSFIKNEMFYIRVENEGSSMSEEQISKIRAFSQFDRETQEQQGVGLGLSLLKGFVELLNGKVFFETFNKNKTILIIEIPIKNDLI